MRRLCVLLVGITFLFVLSEGAFAQGIFGTNIPTGLGSIPLPFTGNAARDTDGSTGSSAGPSLYAGWLAHPRGSTWSLQRADVTGTAQWPLKGFWFGAAKEVAPFDGVGLIASGGLFVPLRSEGTWNESPGGRTFAFDTPQYDWWNVDGLVKCSVSGPFAFLVGFRWDHTSTRLDYSDNTSDDYVLNAYIPLIGALFSQRFAGSSLLLRVLGSPVVRGQAKYHFWDNLGSAEFGDFPVKDSLFLEVFADYQVRFAGNLSAGVFGKWNALRVRTDTQKLEGSTAEPVSWTVNVQSWTFGVDASLEFWSPF